MQLSTPQVRLHMAQKERLYALSEGAGLPIRTKQMFGELARHIFDIGMDEWERRFMAEGEQTHATEGGDTAC